VNHPLKLGETPFMNAFRVASLANPIEVFEDDPLVVRFRVSHDLFADAVIGVRDETPLATRERSPSRPRHKRGDQYQESRPIPAEMDKNYRVGRPESHAYEK
jgi:hypothetical protein